MTNLEAAQATLTELRRMGRIEDVDAAHVQAIESMARALDETPGNAQLWKVYRESLEALTDANGATDDLDALLSELSAP